MPRETKQSMFSEDGRGMEFLIFRYSHSWENEKRGYVVNPNPWPSPYVLAGEGRGGGVVCTCSSEKFPR